MNFDELRLRQAQFDSNIHGKEGDLSQLNTPQYILERGVVGEAIETMQALALYGAQSEEFRSEVVDIWVFFASLLNHIGMTNEELEERTRRIVTKNFIKYPATYDPDKPLLQIMKDHKEAWE